MRDFTKAMTSYMWAMSLFGVQQMFNAFRPGKASESFDNVTHATEDEFGDAMRATFRAGDNLQRGLVDLTFSVFTLGMFDGRGGGSRGATSTAAAVGRQSAEALRQGTRAVGQAADAIGQTVSAAASVAEDAARRGTGWATTGGTRGDATHGGGQRATGASQSGQNASQAQGWGPMPAPSSAGSAAKR